MASPPNEDQSKTMSGGPYPPVPGYPQPHSGYPPPPPQPPPYHGYAPPYPGYPNHPHPHHPNVYPYTAPPPAAFYSPGIYQSMPPEQGSRLSLARVILWMMIILIFGAFLMSFLTWLIFGSTIPAFRVESLTVPIFHIDNSTITGKWEANITVTNLNKKLDIFYYYAETIIFYEDDPLAMASLDPLHVGKNEKGTFVAKLSTMNAADKADDIGLKDIENDRKDGVLIFNLRMAVRGRIASGTVWRRQTSMRVFCDNLEVKFAAAHGAVGTLTNTNGS
ncbi:hypothetical protein F0562_015940 [Nyssa sinensis]|uniref:Late embryogenesis abundant protein LEA-2 subgroup domain-containing protein n=1 Tax=Nyssa sinensis TaxID=561372 RepID=A0A5J4ZLE8_9ASTE|nr:hypothetical protein F0562_015940 [Nyssa sinensis]